MYNVHTRMNNACISVKNKSKVFTHHIYPTHSLYPPAKSAIKNAKKERYDKFKLYNKAICNKFLWVV